MSQDKIYDIEEMEEDIEFNEADIEHMEFIDSINDLMARDEKLLKEVFPNGYEDISLPIDKIAVNCYGCKARTLFIYRACKDKNCKKVLLFCECLKCRTEFGIYEQNNKINVVILNRDLY